MITLTGADLTPDQLIAFVDAGERIGIDAGARERAHTSRMTLLDILERRPVYGRSTGVGANHSIALGDSDTEAGRRLLHSHAGGAGALLPERAARATMVVRANQLLTGAAGVEPALIDAFVAAANSGAYAQLHELGSIGTGDLTALAELALTLAGDRDWIGPGDSRLAPFAIDDLDALALLSSSAVTIAQAALVYAELTRLVDAAVVVAALTFVAIDGSSEPFAAEVHRARPHPGPTAVAARMRQLIEPAIVVSDRIQDPFGLRVLPSVHGVLVEAVRRLEAVLAVELNAGAENPLVSISANDVFHHGNFHQAPLAAAVDAVGLALFSSAQLGCARLATMMEPRFTGLAPFLADGPAGSSGLMITEYAAASALAEIRAAATPATTGNAVLSRGVEEHASFAPLAIRQLTAATAAYRVVVAAELVAAVRAIRMSGRRASSQILRTAFESVAAELPFETHDRPLDGDLALAADLLDGLAGAGSAS
jgi:histidine ammonia-lyase